MKRTSQILFFCTFVFSLVTTNPVKAAFRCEIKGRPWLEGRIKSTKKGMNNTSQAVDAQMGQEIEVFVVAKGFLNRHSVTFSDDGQAGRVPFSKCGPVSVSWRKVEPYSGHVKLKSPNPHTQIYANAVVLGPHHGQWLGFDKMEYFETPLETSLAGTNEPKSTDLLNAHIRIIDARPSTFSAPRSKEHEPLGTMRLTATIKIGEKEFVAPGAKDTQEGMISDTVFRYSFRSGDGFLGWLTSYYNVPYLFGSVDKQVEKRLGADCADIFVAALRLAGKKSLAYTNVGGLIDALGKSAGPSLVKICGKEDLNLCKSISNPVLRFGKEVQPGDILALHYTYTDIIPRAWAHIVVLVEDRGPNGKPDGVLGPHDLVADSGAQDALKFMPLGYQGDVMVLVARPQGVSTW